MKEIETRKRFLINTTFYVVLLGLYYLFMEYAFGFLFPFIFAVFIALVLQKPINLLVKKTRIKKSLASGLCVFVVLIAVLAIFSLIGVKLAAEIRGLFTSLKALADDLPSFYNKAETTLLDLIRFLPNSLEKSAGSSITDFFNNLISGKTGSFDFSVITSHLGGVWSTAKQVPSFVVGIVVAIVSCFFMTSDYDRIISFIKRQLPADKSEALSSSKKIMISSVGKLIKAYMLLMFITFCEILLGLNILKLTGIYKGSYLLATALIIAVVDIVPFLGTGTVLIPWTVYSFIMGSPGLGIGILVMYMIIYVIRQVIEPKLVAANLGLPAILTIMGMYIGGKLFGIFGLFLVPLTLIFVKILNDEGIVKLWKTLKQPDALQSKPSAVQENSAPHDSQNTKENSSVPKAD